jgi:hypothetical protein
MIRFLMLIASVLSLWNVEVHSNTINLQHQDQVVTITSTSSTGVTTDNTLFGYDSIVDIGQTNNDECLLLNYQRNNHQENQSSRKKYNNQSYEYCNLDPYEKAVSSKHDVVIDDEQHNPYFDNDSVRSKIHENLLRGNETIILEAATESSHPLYENEPTTTINDNDFVCRIYIAESTIPHAGLGVFAGISYAPKDHLPMTGDVIIPLQHLEQVSLISK